MKLSFSTSSCPDLSFDKIMLKAKALRFNGIELDSIGNEKYLPNTEDLSCNNLENTLKLLNANGLEVPLLASHTLLCDTKNKVTLMQEPYEYIDLAEKAGIKNISVFADKNTEPSINDDLDIFFIMENLKQVCAYAMPKEINILVETNGIFSDSRFLARMLREINCNNAGVSWNVNNTVRYSFEKPAQTVAVFGNRLKHVHLNDTLTQNGSIEYKPLGRGGLPIKETVAALKENGYSGYISLDWPKRDHPELLDADTILPQFLYYIKNLME